MQRSDIGREINNQNNAFNPSKNILSEFNNCTAIILRELWKISTLCLGTNKYPKGQSPEGYYQVQTKIFRFFHNAEKRTDKVIIPSFITITFLLM